MMRAHNHTDAAKYDDNTHAMIDNVRDRGEEAARQMTKPTHDGTRPRQSDALRCMRLGSPWLTHRLDI